MFNVEQNGLAQMPINDTIKDTYGEQGRRSGERTHFLHCGPRSIPRLDSKCELCLIVLGYVPYCKRVFSRYSTFPLSSKTSISKFNSIQNPRAKGLLVIRLLNTTLVSLFSLWIDKNTYRNLELCSSGNKSVQQKLCLRTAFLFQSVKPSL